MQLNVQVPNDREQLLVRLESCARRLGRPVNLVVLDALERYLNGEMSQRSGAPGAGVIPVFRMGGIAPFRRADLYADRWKG